MQAQAVYTGPKLIGTAPTPVANSSDNEVRITREAMQALSSTVLNESPRFMELCRRDVSLKTVDNIIKDLLQELQEEAERLKVEIKLPKDSSLESLIFHCKAIASTISTQTTILRARDFKTFVINVAETIAEELQADYETWVSTDPKDPAYAKDLWKEINRNRILRDKLDYLEELNLDSQDMCFLPEEIGALPRLSELWLQNNRLARLPSTLCQLEHLELIDLSYNRFRDFPAEVSELGHLKRLYIQHNQLASLPEAIKNLARLKYVNLSQNHFVSLPMNISNHTLLKVLNVSKNPIGKIPEGFYHEGFGYWKFQGRKGVFNLIWEKPVNGESQAGGESFLVKQTEPPKSNLP